jgi:hypothetical protein
MRVLWLAAAALVAAAPLRAQPDARRQPTCVREASVAAGDVMTRRGCAGTDDNAAVRFSAALPNDWNVEWRDGDDLVLTATTDGGIAIRIVGTDRLPDPRSRADTLGFWMRATGMMLGREVDSVREVEEFRTVSEDRVGDAREQVTHRQLEDSVLRAMATALSARNEGREVREQSVEVREMAGEPAGYLDEVWMRDGTAWHSVSYVTVRDGALFVVSLRTPDLAYVNVIYAFDSVVASFNPRTERW